MSIPNYIIAPIETKEHTCFYESDNKINLQVTIIKPYYLTDTDITFISESIKNFATKNIIIKIPDVPNKFHCYIEGYDSSLKEEANGNINRILEQIKNIDIKELTIEYPELESDINFDLSNKLPPTLKTFKLINLRASLLTLPKPL